MWSIIRPMLPMVIILAVPIIPFLLFGSTLENWLKPWEEHPPGPVWIAAGVIGLLATDIFLPVPSSVVSSLAGPHLGIVWGSCASWLGMNLGAIAGFGFARLCGPAWGKWLTKPEELQRATEMAGKFGPAVLAIGRGVPVVAEATVLWAGMNQLSWRQFLPPVLIANLILSVAYASLGSAADKMAGLPLVLALAIAIPVLLAYLLKRWFLPPHPTSETESCSSGSTS